MLACQLLCLRVPLQRRLQLAHKFQLNRHVVVRHSQGKMRLVDSSSVSATMLTTMGVVFPVRHSHSCGTGIARNAQASKAVRFLQLNAHQLLLSVIHCRLCVF